jgi:hypothetical protein
MPSDIMSTAHRTLCFHSSNSASARQVPGDLELDEWVGACRDPWTQPCSAAEQWHDCQVSETPMPPAELLALAREVEEFVSSGGWDQPTQLFALVPTAELLRVEPGLADQLDVNASPLTPVAQESLPEADLADALAGIGWPEQVHGCALSQEIVVLPSEAEHEVSGPDVDPALARKVAAEHPRRKEARIVAAVLRDGSGACVLRVRGDGNTPDDLIEHPELAPNLIDALRATFRD